MPDNISNEAPRSPLGTAPRRRLRRDVAGPATVGTTGPPDPEPVFVRYSELKQYGVPYSRQHLDQLEHQEKFPRRVKLSPGVVVWRLQEVRAWLESRAQREA